MGRKDRAQRPLGRDHHLRRVAWGVRDGGEIASPPHHEVGDGGNWKISVSDHQFVANDRRCFCISQACWYRSDREDRNMRLTSIKKIFSHPRRFGDDSMKSVLGVLR